MAQAKPSQITAKELLQISKATGAQYIFVNAGEMIAECTAGYADILTKSPITGHTTMNLFSVTKTVTAACIMQLAEKKKLLLTDYVNPLFDEFHFKHPFTIAQLVSHQAGFPDPIPISWVHLAGEDKIFDENHFITKTIDANSRQRYIPGSKWHYSSIGYLLLSLIIEKVSGESFTSYVSKNILGNINGDGSLGFAIENESLHATGYHPRFSFSNIILGLFLDRNKFIRYHYGKWIAFKNFYVNGKAYGGLIGNARGLSAYLQSYLSNHIFNKEETKHRMFTEQKRNMSYGWFTGILDGARYVCHAGGGGGYYCEIRIYPDLNLASVILRNRSSFSDLRLLDKLDARFISTRF